MECNFDNNPCSPLSTNTVEISSSDSSPDRAAIQRIYDHLTSSLPKHFSVSETNNSNTSQEIVNQYQHSNSVNPTLASTNENESQVFPCGYVSQKIEIYTQPRAKFRPRTKKESQGSSHYIRCDDFIQPEYPSIKIPSSWKGIKNIIEVTLVDKDKNPHPYTIDTKERQISNRIFKINESDTNTLYFRVTDDDIAKGFQIFTLQYIKSKQDETITKALIESRRLDQSMFRFTRCYETDNGGLYRDDLSSEYSSLMTEDYGHFHVEDVFPLYGSMGGNDKIAIELKGHVPKDIKKKIIVYINDHQHQWFSTSKILDKRGNNITFLMPPCPLHFLKQITVDIVIVYDDMTLFQAEYVYISEIDDIIRKT